MSRDKFEEWYDECYDDIDAGSLVDLLFQVWLAGRESMMDEVIPLIYGNCESDNVAQRTVDAIRKIEL